MDFKLLAHECENPTYSQGMSQSTAMYFQPIFDEEGRNINPDMNTTTTSYTCNKCSKCWNVSTQYGAEPTIRELIR